MHTIFLIENLLFGFFVAFCPAHEHTMDNIIKMDILTILTQRVFQVQFGSVQCSQFNFYWKKNICSTDLRALNYDSWCNVLQHSHTKRTFLKFFEHLHKMNIIWNQHDNLCGYLLFCLNTHNHTVAAWSVNQRQNEFVCKYLVWVNMRWNKTVSQ